jgi:hypothetical protein
MSSSPYIKTTRLLPPKGKSRVVYKKNLHDLPKLSVMKKRAAMKKKFDAEVEKRIARCGWRIVRPFTDCLAGPCRAVQRIVQWKEGLVLYLNTQVPVLFFLAVPQLFRRALVNYFAFADYIHVIAYA